MKTYKYLFVLSFFCLVCSSCQKFVDIKKSSDQSLIATANDCQLIMDNYALFNSNYPYDGEISANDYYLNALDYNDVNTSSEDRAIYSWDAKGIRLGAEQWVNSYKKVYNTNLVLETLQKLQGKENAAVLNNLRGSALFLRAYAMWNLAQLYIKPYGATAAQDPGLPIHLVSDINDTPGRGTVQETYNRIVQDLKEAADLMNTTNNVPSRPTKIAALAMLARVYLSMEDYTNAALNANAALQLKSDLLDFNTFDVENPFPFTRYNKEVIFHSILGNSTFLSPGSPAFNVAKIDDNLVNSYAEGDLRGTFFISANAEVNAGSFRFTGNYEPTTNSNLFNGLAVDELYIIRAECYARAGNAGLAMADLNTLLRTRWATGSYTDMTATSSDDALVKVLTERRKELLMRAQRWTDLRRLNKDERFKTTLTRTVTTGSVNAVFTLPANDLRYTLLIPQEVITNSKLTQNPR